MYAVDLHAHTRAFHGHRRLGDLFDPIGVRLLAWETARRGLDGVATTNHDYYTPFSPSGATVIPGVEVSTTRGHVLIVGPDPPRETDPSKLTPEETVALAHDRDCAAIIAHPFRNSTVTDLDDLPFDAIEINGKHPQTRPLVAEIAEKRNVPLVGGSDAHYPIEAGRAYTLIDAPELTPEAVVRAIRDGRVEARVRNGIVDGLLRRFYREVHRRKHPESVLGLESPGIGVPSDQE